MHFENSREASFEWKVAILAWARVRAVCGRCRWRSLNLRCVSAFCWRLIAESCSSSCATLREWFSRSCCSLLKRSPSVSVASLCAWLSRSTWRRSSLSPSVSVASLCAWLSRSTWRRSSLSSSVSVASLCTWLSRSTWRRSCLSSVVSVSSLSARFSRNLCSWLSLCAVVSRSSPFLLWRAILSLSAEERSARRALSLSLRFDSLISLCSALSKERRRLSSSRLRWRPASFLSVQWTTLARASISIVTDLLCASVLVNPQLHDASCLWPVSLF